MTSSYGVAVLYGAFVAGLLGGLGPCAPLRFAVLGAVAHGRAVWRDVAMFLFGGFVATALLVLGLRELSSALNVSSLMYALAALSMFVVGVKLLGDLGDSHANHESGSSGGLFLSGLVQGIIVQPCCAAGLIWLVAQVLTLPFWVGLLASALFALGQGAIVLAAPLLRRIRVTGALRASYTWALGTFSLICGIYYAFQV